MSDQVLEHRDVASLKAAHPIAGVIAGYGIALRPSGAALVGCCPFHEDAGRPNLHVYPDTGSYYCYRCGQGGDAIDFVRRRERLGFVAACDRLAGSSPRPVPPAGVPPSPDWEHLGPTQQRVMDLALGVYLRTLRRTPGALAYLAGRRITGEVIDTGLLGYADGRSLAIALRDDLGTAQQLGLLRPDRRGSLVERFAGRIVVAEQRGGHAIWCIGRAWAARGPKFLSLAGARPLLGAERSRGQADVVLVEGVFDWLTAIGWGLPACSLCGTHGSARQLQALDGARRIYGVFDADAAGRAAEERLRQCFGPRWRPLRLPDGCDLNDLGLRPDGRRCFCALLQAADATADHGGPRRDAR